jgi:hypothetical protein
MLDIPRISFEVFGISMAQIQKTWNGISHIRERHPEIRKPGMRYPKLENQ